MVSYPLTPEVMTLVAARFKVLGEPVRLQLLHVLQQGEQSVTELANLLKTSQPNVSKHLKLLGESGFVARRQEGNTVFYSIADPSVYQLCDLVCSSLRERLDGQSAMLRPRRRK
jgi:DNA-binding transcriptional ArsR family regulator